jgi:protein PsiE
MIRSTKRYASLSLRMVENAGLLVIAIATVIAGVQEVNVMIAAARVTLADLLLMFIGMVALARYLILDMKDLDVWRMLGVSTSIVLLALAVLAIRYGHVRFAYPEDDTTLERQEPAASRRR